MKALFGTRKENEDWQEELITENEDKFTEAMAWAEENGFDRFRIVTVDGSVPDFAGCVRRNKK